MYLVCQRSDLSGSQLKHKRRRHIYQPAVVAVVIDLRCTYTTHGYGVCSGQGGRWDRAVATANNGHRLRNVMGLDTLGISRVISQTLRGGKV